MSEIHLDCKGLSCPQPVLNCKNAVDASNPVRISAAVDNEAARENVARFLNRSGYDVETESGENGCWEVRGVRDHAPSAPETAPVPHAEKKQDEERITVFITSETLGRGDDTLGAGLMKNFLATLPEMGESLWQLILVNGAVKLAVEGSACLDKLRALEDSGIVILVCGTCLDHFNLLEQKRVGETTNMLDVVTGLQNGTKVIRV